MTTVAAIAALALTRVSAKITDAVATATMTIPTQGAYDVTTGTYALILATQTGRAVFCNITAGPDMFPDYTFGPRDELLLLEGFTGVTEGAVLTIGSTDRTVRATQDLMGAGTLFYAVAR